MLKKKKNSKEQNCKLIEHNNIKNFMFSKLMCSNIFVSKRIGERLYGSIAQPALLLTEINFKLKTFYML